MGMLTRQMLADRIAELEHVLGITAAMPCYCTTGLPRSQRIVLGLLLHRTIVTTEAILIATRKSPADDHTSVKPNLATVHITHVRRYLRKRHGVAVHLAWGEGWYLTAEDQRRISESLRMRS